MTILFYAVDFLYYFLLLSKTYMLGITLQCFHMSQLGEKLKNLPEFSFFNQNSKKMKATGSVFLNPKNNGD